MSETGPESRAPLTLVERRVLGVLIEKQKTTPDSYPLSVNALVTGSNQKSNRDPILSVDDVAIEDALATLQANGLTAKIESGRVEKWRHLVYEKWQVTKEEIAVLAELLLRGPQTEGELRARANRMEPFADREALRSAVQPLVQRGLAVWLSPEGRRGALLTHGFYDQAELESLRTRHAAGAVERDSVPASRFAPEASAKIEQLQVEISDLRNQVAELRAQIQALSPPPANP